MYVYEDAQTGVHLSIGEASTNDKKVNMALVEVTDIVDQNESFSIDRSINRCVPSLRRYIFFLLPYFLALSFDFDRAIKKALWSSVRVIMSWILFLDSRSLSFLLLALSLSRLLFSSTMMINNRGKGASWHRQGQEENLHVRQLIVVPVARQQSYLGRWFKLQVVRFTTLRRFF